MKPALERYRNILDFALSSLWRRKGKNLALLVMYTLVIFVIASLIFFTQSLKREARFILADAPDLVVQRLMAGSHDLIPNAYADRIRAIRGVSEVRPRLWGYYYDPISGANYTVLTAPEGEPAAGSIRIGSGVARAYRFAAGDFLSLKSAATGKVNLFRVAEILPSASELVAADLIEMRESELRALFNFPEGRATDLAVIVRNQSEIATVAAKIALLFPDTRPILKSEMLRTYDSLFDWRGGLLVVVLGSAVLSFVIFAWDKATGLSAEERKEIGVLKSIGWETGDVLLLKSWEGIAVSLTAFLVGTTLAYLHVFCFDASLLGRVLKGWSVIYPQFRLAPEIDLFQLAVLFFLTVGPYTAATIVPSWLAATVDPDAAMRS